MTKLIKMERDGHKVDVHPDMIEDYKAGGYVALQEEEKAEEVKPKRGRKAKSEG